jgi:hypothetical protein
MARNGMYRPNSWSYPDNGIPDYSPEYSADWADYYSDILSPRNPNRIRTITVYREVY